MNSQTRSARQLGKNLKHQHTTSMPGLARKAVSKSPLRTKGELSRTASFALPTETTTPPAHVRKRSLSASRRAELEPVLEECPNCENLRHRERATLAALSELKYQMHLCVEALHSWRAGGTLDLPNLNEELRAQLGQHQFEQSVNELMQELSVLQTAITGLAKDVEVLSRHAVWENVSIVKRKEPASREILVQKAREARALLTALRQVCTAGKAAPPQLSPSDPALLRSLKLQLQEAVRERLACEVRLKSCGKPPEWLETALKEALEAVQLA